MTTSDVLSIERDGAVATLWLDNPDRRNAMGPAFWADLPKMIEELSDDPDVRAVVVAARGPHFTVGLDLKAVSLAGGGETGGDAGSGEAGSGDAGSGDAGSGEAGGGEAGGGEAGRSGGGPRSQAARATAFLREVKRMQRSITAVADCPKPVIAAVHGACIGGGIDLITACDVRLASADAFFSVRETKIAIVADVGTLQRLPGIVGKGHVAELAYTGKDISAERAAQIGLVNDVLADVDALHKAAREMAAEIAANSPLAVMGTKAVLEACAGRTIDEGLDYVAVWNAAFLASDDLNEAMTAFIEKRPPRFTGR